MNTHDTKSAFLAFDFGAESARAVTGELNQGILTMTEVHRFPTKTMYMNGHYYWNVYRFFEEMIYALSKCKKETGLAELTSVAINTWGVDFGILTDQESLHNLPYAYRDPQGAEAMKDFHSDRMTPAELYKNTGVAMQAFNSLYQLHAMQQRNEISTNHRIMFLPDLLSYFLCGKQKTERTMATTTQLYNPFNENWDKSILKTLGIDRELMNPIIKPGTHLGILHPWIASLTGLPELNVVSVCSHDTASAVVAIPVKKKKWAFISSGTWSLMGIEIDRPLISEKSFKYNFTNEGGAEDSFRFQKNIMGLWLLQECKRKWERQGDAFTYSMLVDMASQEKPFQYLIDPDHMSFYINDDMPGAINEFCHQSGQTAPESAGSYARVIFESLALKYRMVLDQIKEISGEKPEVIHIIGGGSQNQLLCQFAANATGLVVEAGPIEGSALGNIMMQALAAKAVNSLAEIRNLIANNCLTKKYYPADSESWEKAYSSFRDICK